MREHTERTRRGLAGLAVLFAHRQSDAGLRARAIAQQHGDTVHTVRRCHHPLRDQRPHREHQRQQNHRAPAIPGKVLSDPNHAFGATRLALGLQGCA